MQTLHVMPIQIKCIQCLETASSPSSRLATMFKSLQDSRELTSHAATHGEFLGETHRTSLSSVS